MNSPSVSRTVADNCRAEAARRAFTTQDLSTGSGIARITLGRRLSGQSPFTIDEIVAIAKTLGVPLSTLLAGVDVKAKASA